MNKKLVMLAIGFGIVTGIVLYTMPAAAKDIPLGISEYSIPQVPYSELAECEFEVGRLMEIGGSYITKEATALQMVKDLQDIVNDKDLEIALLNKQMRNSMVKP